MEILLAILVLLVVVVVLLLIKIKKEIKAKEELKQQAIFLSKKELEFLEFVADMYIKYSVELNLYTVEQHEYLIAEIKKVQTKLVEKINSLSEEQRLP